MKNLKYTLLSAFFFLSLNSCDLLLPDGIVNPNVSDDTFLESDNAMQAWVNGANRSFAEAMGNYCMLMEILSDNYFNNYSRTSQVFDMPRILYTDADVADLQRYVGMLRETADYGIGPVADADPATTREDLFNLYYIKAISFMSHQYSQGGRKLSDSGRGVSGCHGRGRGEGLYAATACPCAVPSSAGWNQ